jgi:hypothetical protein
MIKKYEWKKIIYGLKLYILFEFFNFEVEKYTRYLVYNVGF